MTTLPLPPTEKAIIISNTLLVASKAFCTAHILFTPEQVSRIVICGVSYSEGEGDTVYVIGFEKRRHLDWSM